METAREECIEEAVLDPCTITIVCPSSPKVQDTGNSPSQDFDLAKSSPKEVSLDPQQMRTTRLDHVLVKETAIPVQLMNNAVPTLLGGNESRVKAQLGILKVGRRI